MEQSWGLVFLLLVYFFNLRNTILVRILFGIVVCNGLDIVLFTSSSAQDKMFTMTPITCIGGLVGHVAFGLVLGLFMKDTNL